jgi:hypothetical protein
VTELVLGPLLRHVGEHDAVVWVETDAPCEVEVRGCRESTFHVSGHHYALVVVDGLEPGGSYDYEVALDGERCWPLSDAQPSTIRTLDRDRPVRVSFGSCRVAAPHGGAAAKQFGYDALRAYALRLERDEERPPHALILLGDQVYVDEAAPQTRAFARSRRDTSRPPGEGTADFEEYVMLYHESWGDPVIRRLLATVSTSMIFDDHELHDDWNISEAWVHDMREEDWFRTRVVGAFSSYWLYQHLGNLSPEALREDELYRRVREAGDGEPLLRELALRQLETDTGARWSYARDLGHTRLVVIDSRAGRVLHHGVRKMVDDDEWSFVVEQARTEGSAHVLLATSLPYLLAPGIHDLEAWNERVCAGAWGRRAARVGEKIRRGIDLDHWAAFQESFRSLGNLLAQLDEPRSVVLLSGDVHYSYHAPASLPHVHQVVISPLRNRLAPRERWAQELALSPVGRVLGRALARLANVPRPPFTWRIVDGPWFDSAVGTLDLDERSAVLRIECCRSETQLARVLERRLD